MIVSILLPLFDLSAMFESSPVYQSIPRPASYLMPVIVIDGGAGKAESAWSFFKAADIPLYIYVCVSAVFLVLFMARLLQLRRLMSRSVKNARGGYKVYELNDETGHFSFFNNIFIGRNSLSHYEKVQVITHEMIHSRQFHSLDMMIMEMALVIQWINPFLWLIKRALVETHEFIADTAVIRSGFKIKDYQSLIYNQITGKRLFVLSNQFSRKQIKRRLKMMSKGQPKRLSVLKYFLILPLAGIMIFLAACKQDGSNPSIAGGYIMNQNLDKFPEPEEGLKKVYEYVESNTKMPEEAKRNHINAKIVVGFIVEDDGSLSNFKINYATFADPQKAVKKIGYGCDEEAMRVVKTMPFKWKPAILKGKPVRQSMFIDVFFGSQEVFEAKNPYSIMVETILSPEQKEMVREQRKKEKAIKNSAPPPRYSEWGVVKYPEFPEMIAKNIHYPENQRKNDVSGVVYASFVIDEKGNITDAKIEKGINKDFDDEVLRVIHLIKPVEPAKGPDGKPIKYKVTIPVKFKLE
jgi:TonB family protein